MECSRRIVSSMVGLNSPIHALWKLLILLQNSRVDNYVSRYPKRNIVQYQPTKSHSSWNRFDWLARQILKPQLSHNEINCSNVAPPATRCLGSRQSTFDKVFPNIDLTYIAGLNRHIDISIWATNPTRALESSVLTERSHRAFIEVDQSHFYPGPWTYD